VVAPAGGSLTKVFLIVVLGRDENRVNVGMGNEEVPTDRIANDPINQSDADAESIDRFDDADIHVTGSGSPPFPSMPNIA
jgi:hypothetical protein